jgi:hypothetical protein
MSVGNDEYMRGMANGLVVAVKCAGGEAEFLDAPNPPVAHTPEEFAEAIHSCGHKNKFHLKWGFNEPCEIFEGFGRIL